jgi:hypothetical protein
LPPAGAAAPPQDAVAVAPPPGLPQPGAVGVSGIVTPQVQPGQPPVVTAPPPQTAQ